MLGKVRALTRAQAEGYGCTWEIREGVPGAVLVNDEGETLRAAEIARGAFGEEDVIYPGPTFLGSEDFAFMLQKKKGTYCFLGNGDTPMVHHPRYVFNQDILPGAQPTGWPSRRATCAEGAGTFLRRRVFFS